MKIRILIAALCFAGFAGFCHAGPFVNIQSKSGNKIPDTHADDYIYIGNNQYIECDDDDKDADNGVVAIWWRQNMYVASVCKLTTFNDYWSPVVLQWCADKNKCPNNFDKTIDGRGVCFSGRHKKLGGVILLETYGDACITCENGWSYDSNKQTCIAGAKNTNEEKKKEDEKPSDNKGNTNKTNKAPDDKTDANGPDSSSVDCNSGIKEWLREQKKTHYACVGVSALADQILGKCESKPFQSDSEITKMTDDLEIRIKKCADAVANEKLAAEQAETARIAKENSDRAAGLKGRISNAKARVDSLTPGAIAALSADAKADYTKKRIISDSVAGIILGTGGGFLVNHIIKNNQLNSGFDSISCQMAGQTVAGWGDQFRIGYNK